MELPQIISPVEKRLSHQSHKLKRAGSTPAWATHPKAHPNPQLSRPVVFHRRGPVNAGGPAVCRLTAPLQGE